MHPRPAALIHELQLTPHAEGGHYRRVYASELSVQTGGRSRRAASAIRFLLLRGEVSQWHRIDADEVWHWQEGGALELLQFDPTAPHLLRTRLGDSAAGLTPMQIVPAGTWQSARPLGDYALVCCMVSPGFEWDGFELLDDETEVAREISRLESPPATGRRGKGTG